MVAMHYGWRMGFYVFGGAGMVLALVLYAFLREPARGEAERGQPCPREPGTADRATGLSRCGSHTSLRHISNVFASYFVRHR